MRHDETWWDYWTYWTLGAVRVSTSLQRLPSTLVRNGPNRNRMAENGHEFTRIHHIYKIRKGSKRSKTFKTRDTIWYRFSDSCKVISGDIWWSSNTLWPKCDLLRSMGSPELPQNVTSIKNSVIRTVSPPGGHRCDKTTLRQWLLDKTLNSAASFWIPGKIWKDLERSG